MLRLKRTKKVCFYRLFLFSYFLFFALLFNSALAGGILPDTGQTKCFDNTHEIPCPAPGGPYFGQDGNYQGPQPAYQVSADGLVVTDMNTGLMWQRANDGVTRNWTSAVSYCNGLVLGEYSDWRLPSRHELFSIVDYGRYNLAINPVFSCQASFYWSSSTKRYANINYAWQIDFKRGYTDLDTQDYFHYVRCIRGDSN